MTRCFIEQQQSGLMGQRTSKGDSLALSSCQSRGAFGHYRLIAHRHFFDVVVDCGEFRCSGYLLKVEGWIVEGDIFSDRPAEKACVLKHNSYLIANGPIIQCLQRNSVIENFSTGWRIESEQ